MERRERSSKRKELRALVPRLWSNLKESNQSQLTIHNFLEGFWHLDDEIGGFMT